MSSSSNKAETSSSDEDNETAPSDGLNLAPADPDFDIFIGGHKVPRRYVTESDNTPWTLISDDEESEHEEALDVITKPPPEHCKMCLLVHSSWDNCHNLVCECCYSKSHYATSCPYTWSFPRGEKYDDKVYDVHCASGCPFFDKENWVCDSSFCFNTEAMLVLKECVICCSRGNHNTYDCPEDKERAAEFYKFMKEAY